jgi:hypothetical protein
VPKILAADRDAIGNKDTYDDAYFEAFFTNIRPVLEQQMAGAITGTASAIAGAWTRPEARVEDLDPPHGSEGQEALAIGQRSRLSRADRIRTVRSLYRAGRNGTARSSRPPVSGAARLSAFTKDGGRWLARRRLGRVTAADA